jgi:hypothetical protein
MSDEKIDFDFKSKSISRTSDLSNRRFKRVAMKEIMVLRLFEYSKEQIRNSMDWCTQTTFNNLWGMSRGRYLEKLGFDILDKPPLPESRSQSRKRISEFLKSLSAEYSLVKKREEYKEILRKRSLQASEKCKIGLPVVFSVMGEKLCRGKVFRITKGEPGCNALSGKVIAFLPWTTYKVNWWFGGDEGIPTIPVSDTDRESPFQTPAAHITLCFPSERNF